MFNVIFGYNTTAEYFIFKTGGSEYRSEIPAGYFITEIKADKIANFEIRFYNSQNQDITSEFE